jgi:dipeptidyl-peptidase-4
MMGQTKKLTLEDLMPGGATYRFTENLYNLQWWGDICIKPTIDKLIGINPKDGKETVLSNLSKVNSVLEANKLGKLTAFYYVRLPWEDRSEMVFPLHQKLIVYNFKTDEIVKTTEMNKEGSNQDISNESGNIAYTIKNNLYVNGDAVTNEPEGVVCGQSVHRNEFGISKGTFWSPSGKLLAFYRMDESMVGQYPLVDTEAREGKAELIRYPMAGMTSHKVTVGVYNPETKKTIYLNVGDPTDRYFTNISWSPDEKSVYLIELNRDQNHSKLCRYDAATGELQKVLIEETNDKYVEPLHPITFLPWDSNKFIYQSQRDGFNHLYLYNTDGKLIGQLTKGNWLVQGLLGFNKKTKSVIIEGGVALNTNLYIVNIPAKKCSKALSKVTEAVHSGSLSGSGQYLLDRYSTPTSPRNIDILDLTTSKSNSIFKAKSPYEGYEMPDINVGTIKAADGVTDLYYRIVKPKNMEPGKKYPAIVYVYGGPHAQMIHNNWLNDARGWDIYMANKGYIIFTLDNRGSENRGFMFESATFRHLGIEEGKDQIKGVEFLKSLPYIDSNRIGVHGWSFGGHMTTGMMLRYPDTFKVGVAGGPVIDWKYYEVMYGERYMDTPQTNPEGYKQCDLKNYAGNLKGHLLIIHDDHDDTCVPQHSITFLKACVNAGTYPDFFTYPGHKHNVMGKDRVHLYEKITRYFVDYL